MARSRSSSRSGTRPRSRHVTSRHGGRAIYAAVEAPLRGRFNKIRIGVLSRNEGAPALWPALGFVANGERKRHELGSVVDDVVVLEKVLG